MMRRCLLVAVAGLVVLACRIAWAQGTEPVRESPAQADTLRAVAVTIDDLPGVVPGDLSALTRVTHHLLDHLTANDIPAIGFVNEAKLERPGEKDARIALLQQWVEAGLELGNHGYAHRSFHATPFDTFTADVLRGEVVTRRLLAERGLVPRYFRHPYLHTGQARAAKDAFTRFLDEHGYAVAPVTLDNSEWIYAAAYNKAQGDSALMQRVGEAYIRYMEAVFAFYESFSHDLLGYQVKHILLLHANALNADYLDDLARMIKRRGYSFIPLEEALRDEAYRLGDPYLGSSGVSWLQRWAVGRGEEPRKEPPVDAFVRELSGQ